MPKSHVTIVKDQKRQVLKNPLLKTFLSINIAHSLNIKRKSLVDATKTFLICEKRF